MDRKFEIVNSMIICNLRSFKSHKFSDYDEKVTSKRIVINDKLKIQFSFRAINSCGWRCGKAVDWVAKSVSRPNKTYRPLLLTHSSPAKAWCNSDFFNSSSAASFCA